MTSLGVPRASVYGRWRAVQRDLDETVLNGLAHHGHTEPRPRCALADTVYKCVVFFDISVWHRVWQPQSTGLLPSISALTTAFRIVHLQIYRVDPGGF